jgi:probable phosphoglycerate mutase
MRTTAAEHVPSATRHDVMDELEALFRLDGEDAGELLLVRHAREAARFDAESPADPMLSCEGLQQAERLAERLGNQWIEAVYTAPERRAFQTAKIVADYIARPLRTIDALAEIDFDPAQAAPGAAQRFAQHPRWESLPGFANGVQFRRRAIQALDAIVAAHAARRAIVVTHASVINAYLSMLLGVPRDLFFAPDHASISVIRHQVDAYALRSLNDTAHLAGGRPDAATPPLTARSLPLTNR